MVGGSLPRSTVIIGYCRFLFYASLRVSVRVCEESIKQLDTVGASLSPLSPWGRGEKSNKPLRPDA
jgi:hypothetical protein